MFEGRGSRCDEVGELVALKLFYGLSGACDIRTIVVVVEILE
jgi:hypothetical protein